MNILFLDCDGVINSKQHFLMTEGKKVEGKDTPKEADLEVMKFHTNSNNMWCLKYILNNVPDLQVVISSAWRNAFDLEVFRAWFHFYGLDGQRIIDKTPKRLSSTRDHEIRLWLAEGDNYMPYQVSNFKWVSLDDHAIFGLNDTDRQKEIQTNPWVGLTLVEAVSVIQRFNPNFKEPIVWI